MSSFVKTLLDEQIENYRIQRHDFLNNVQVIRGYLQLNRPEKALAYIDEAIDALGPQQEIYKVGQKELLAVLMGWFFGLRLKGVEMHIHFPDEMKKENFWQERWQEEYARRFHGYTKDCVNRIPLEENPEALLADIQLISTPTGFGCKFQLLREDETVFQIDF